MALGEPHESSESAEPDASSPSQQPVDAVQRSKAPPHREPPVRESIRHDPRWSGIPLAASLALVAFAVFFGIYGPRVGDRITPPLGIPAWDLGEAAATRFHEESGRAIHGPGASRSTLAEAERDVQSLIGSGVQLPDLSAQGWTVHSPTSVVVPGSARAVSVPFSRSMPGGAERLGLFLVPDLEQYVVFSPFGRPLFLPPWEAYPIQFPPDAADDAVALLWSDGSIIRILVARSESVLSEVATEFLEATRPRDGKAAEDEPDADSSEGNEPKPAEK